MYIIGYMNTYLLYCAWPCVDGNVESAKVAQAAGDRVMRGTTIVNTPRALGDITATDLISPVSSI